MVLVQDQGPFVVIVFFRTVLRGQKGSQEEDRCHQIAIKLVSIEYPI